MDRMEDVMKEEQYVGTSRAADILGLKRDRVSALCREGKAFPGAEQDGVGKPWRIPISDIIAYASRTGKAINLILQSLVDHP